jgi:hypothetical protein
MQKHEGGNHLKKSCFSFRWIALCFLLWVKTAPASEPNVFFSAATHGFLATIGEQSSAAVDFSLLAGWVPVPEILIGMEGGVLIPLGFGKSSNPEGTMAQAGPFAMLRLGDPEKWAYLKLGSELAWPLENENRATNWLLVGAAGFAVAPRDLRIYFGFEVAGEFEVSGPPLRTIGIGGFLGYAL